MKTKPTNLHGFHTRSQILNQLENRRGIDDVTQSVGGVKDFIPEKEYSPGKVLPVEKTIDPFDDWFGKHVFQKAFPTHLRRLQRRPPTLAKNQGRQNNRDSRN
jgi:hypothetical protein